MLDGCRRRRGWKPSSFLPYRWGGRVGGVSRLRFPPGPHLRSSRFSRHPRLRQAPTRRFAKNRNLRGFTGLWWAAHSPESPGPKPPGDLAHRPLGPGSRHFHRAAEFLISCGVGSQNPFAATISPNPLTLGGVGWLPKAELFCPRPGQQAPEPCIPAA